MAKRAKPAWGNLGVICLKGYGQTDDRLTERGSEQRRGDRGCVFSDEQFDRLTTHLNLTDPRLDFVRGFYLRSRLYEAASPTQAERDAALAVVKARGRSF